MALYSPGGLNLADTTAPLILGYNNTGSTDVVFAVSSSGDLTITPDGGDVLIAGNLNVLAEADLRLQDASGGQYAGFDAPATVSSSYVLTLPAAVGGSGQALRASDGAGALEWYTPGDVGDITSVVAGTGLSGGGTTGAVTLNVEDPFVGNVTGNCSGTAATVTSGAQTAISSTPNLATVGTIGTGVWNAGAVTSSGLITGTGGLTLSNGATDADILNTIVNSATNLFFGVSDSSANRFTGSSNNYAFWGTSSAHGLEFATNNNVRLAIDSAGASTFTGDLKLATTKKLYFDGGSDTYIHEGAANDLRLTVGGVLLAQVTATAWDMKQDVILAATKKIYLDGGGDTYIYESSANNVQIIVGGAARFDMGVGHMAIPATNKFYLDGGSDTYLFESSGNNVQFFVGGAMRFDLGIGHMAIPATNKLYLDGGSNTYINEPAADQIDFFTGGAERLKITSAQFQIGTATNIAGNLTVTATGPHAVGIAAADYIQWVQGGAFTSGGATTRAGALVVRTVLTGADGDTAIQTAIGAGTTWGTAITTQANSETIGVVSTAHFSEPDITKGNDTVTVAATVYIKDAPSEGAANAALYVAAGTTIINGDIDMSGGGDFYLANAKKLYIDSGGDTYLWHSSSNNVVLHVGGQDCYTQTATATTFAKATTFSSTLSVTGNVVVGNTVTNPVSGYASQKGLGFAAATGNLEVSANASVALELGRYTNFGAIQVFRYANTTVGTFSVSTGPVLDLAITGHMTIAAAKRLYLDGGGHTFITEASGDRIEVHTNNAERLRITDAEVQCNQNLIINTTKKLYLDGGSDTYIKESSANNINIVTGDVVAMGFDSAQNVIMKATARLYLDGGGDTYITESSGNTISFYAGNSRGMFVGPTYMGVAATDVIYLDGGGDTYIHESSANNVQIIVGGAARFDLGVGHMAIPATNKLYLDGGSNTYIHEVSADQVQIVASGVVSAQFSSTQWTLPADARIYLDGGSDTFITESQADVIQFVTGSNDAVWIGSSGLYIGAYSGNKQIRASSAGGGSDTLYIGNQSITTSSDRRLKTNIVDSSLNAVDALNQLRVTDFNWDDPSDTSFNNKNARGLWTGMIAQEVVEHLPFVVNAPRDEDKVIDHDYAAPWSIDPLALCGVLVKAVQELTAKLEELENG